MRAVRHPPRAWREPRRSPSERFGAAISLLLLAGALSHAAAADLRVPQDGNLAEVAAAVPDGGVIEVSPGTYVPPVGGWRLDDLEKSFTVRAAPGAAVVFDGLGSRELIWIKNSSSFRAGTITFQDITFRRGYGSAFQLAGGITFGRAKGVFERCVFEDNEARTTTTGGGAILLHDGSAVVVRDSVFTGNRAATEGGAIVAYDSRLEIERSEFRGNHTNVPGHRDTSSGGAVALLDGYLSIERSRFEGNAAGFTGGAVYGFGSWSAGDQPNGHVLIDNCTFQSNIIDPQPGIVPPEPEQGGAVHIEDQARMDIKRSRFYGNEAAGGGAVNGYRAAIVVEDSILRGNLADGVGEGTGFGGTIGLLSGDTARDEPFNHPSGSLTVRRSFIQCGGEGATPAAQSGGAIFASGDRNRLYGIDVRRMGTARSNAARVILEDLAIVDCQVRGTGIAGEGGGFELALADADLTDVVVVRSGASGALGNGGGGRLVFQSDARLTRVTFAGNHATHLGAGMVALGSTIFVKDSTFAANDLSPGVSEVWGQSAGAGLFTGPILDFRGYQIDVGGTVRDSVFVDNVGIAIFDDDRADGPINEVRYDSNLFDEDTFGPDIYQDPVMGPPVSAQGLNQLVVLRSGNEPNTDKSIQANTDAPAVSAALLAVPPAILRETAVGDPETSTPSFIVHGWGGASASLNGSPVFANGGFEEATAPSRHTLEVGSLRVSVEVIEVTPLFDDGFESGALERWSSASP